MAEYALQLFVCRGGFQTLPALCSMICYLTLFNAHRYVINAKSVKFCQVLFA